MPGNPSPSGIIGSAAVSGARRLATGAAVGARTILTGAARIPFSRREFMTLIQDIGVGIAIDTVVSYAAEYSDWVKENQSAISLLACFGAAAKTGGLSKASLVNPSTSKQKRAFFGAPLKKASRATFETMRNATVSMLTSSRVKVSSGKHWFSVAFDRATKKFSVDSSIPEVAAALLLVGIGNKDVFDNDDETIIQDALLSLAQLGLAHVVASHDSLRSAQALAELRETSTYRLLAYPVAITKKIAEKYGLTLDEAASLREQVTAEEEEWLPGHHFCDFGSVKDTKELAIIIGHSTLALRDENEFPIDERPKFVLKPTLMELVPAYSIEGAAMVKAVDHLLRHSINLGYVSFYHPKRLTGSPTFVVGEGDGKRTFEYALSRASLEPSSYKEGLLMCSWAQFVAYREIDKHEQPLSKWYFTMVGRESLLDDHPDFSDVTALDDDYAITPVSDPGLNKAVQLDSQEIELEVNAEQLLLGLFGDNDV